MGQNVDLRISQIDKILANFCPKFLDLYTVIEFLWISTYTIKHKFVSEKSQTVNYNWKKVYVKIFRMFCS